MGSITILAESALKPTKMYLDGNPTHGVVDPIDDQVIAAMNGDTGKVAWLKPKRV